MMTFGSIVSYFAATRTTIDFTQLTTVYSLGAFVTSIYTPRLMEVV